MLPIALGLIGLVYQFTSFSSRARSISASLDWLDWAPFFVAPMRGDASLIAGIYGA
jgi:hypothetical protein